MHYTLVAFATLALSMAPVQKPNDYKQALRDTLKLPDMRVRFSVDLDEVDGFTFSWRHSSTTADPAREIESLVASMEGNASDAIRYSKIGRYYSALQQSEAASVAWTKAAELYQQCLREDPDNEDCLHKLGMDLQMLDRLD